MLHAIIPMPTETEVDTPALQQTLTLLAASLDTRFVQAGGTLADAIAVVDRVIAALEGIATALDERSAGAAVASLEDIARHLNNLPETQAARGLEITTLIDAGRNLNGRVLEMHQSLRVLRIYGMNIKIAASGEPHFVAFVDGMADRLALGEQHLDGFLTKLKELTGGVAAVRQSERLLASECVAILPRVPEQLAGAAGELRVHLDGLSTMASRVAVIARDIHGRIATVLGALQVGDSTRQRLEHVVSALEILAARGRADDADAAVEAAVRAHVHEMLVGHLTATATDFERESNLMLTALRDLGPDTSRLLALMEAERNDEGRDVLQQLEQSISYVEPVIARLGEAGERSSAMVRVIADVVDDLTARLDGLRQVRLHVQDIGTNTRLMCRRFGTIGKAVSVIATEVDVYATRLGDVMGGVAAPIEELAVVSVSMRAALDQDGSGVLGGSLAGVLTTIRHGCQQSERGVREACDDARQFIDVLETACIDLGGEMGCGAAMHGVAQQLVSLGSTPIPSSDAEIAALQATFDTIASLYTMASERAVHDEFLLPGMTGVSSATTAAPACHDDLFDDALF